MSAVRLEEIVLPVTPGFLGRWDWGPRKEVDRSNRNQAIASLP